MPTQDDIAAQEALLRAYRQTLGVLLTQQAKFTSAYAPPHIVNGIIEARSKIAEIKQTLRDWGAPVEDLPDDVEPPKDPNDDQPLVPPGGIQAGGDVAVTNVGNGARDVVVVGKSARDVAAGRNIFKLTIGTLAIPALPIVATLLVALVGSAFGLWFYQVPARMPDGSLNVAIAEFGQIDDQGHLKPTNDSKLLSRMLFTEIQRQFQKEPPFQQASLVWHDSMNIFQKRATIGVIPDDSQETCKKRASDLNAKIVVFGMLDARTNPAQLFFQFCTYTVPNQSQRDTGTLQELQGVDRFGSPIMVRLPITNEVWTNDRKLQVRTNLLARLVVGLRYELSEADDFQASLRLALKQFTEALNYLNGEGISADESLQMNGGDLVYYFIGRENFLLFQDPATTDMQEKQKFLDDAQANFQRATNLNPQYARAWSALGGVYFLQARQAILNTQPAEEALARGIDAYQKAIPAAQAAQDTAAEAEAQLSLAQTYWLQAYAFLGNNPSDVTSADASLQQAEQQIGRGLPLIQPDQNRFEGYAAMVRGLVAHLRAQMSQRAGNMANARTQFDQAKTYYQQCIDASKQDPGDLFLQRQIVQFTCEPKMNNVAQALLQLQQ